MLNTLKILYLMIANQNNKIQDENSNWIFIRNRNRLTYCFMCRFFQNISY